MCEGNKTLRRVDPVPSGDARQSFGVVRLRLSCSAERTIPCTAAGTAPAPFAHHRPRRRYGSLKTNRLAEPEAYTLS